MQRAETCTQATRAERRGSRLHALDALRGIAMLFVLVAHFAPAAAQAGTIDRRTVELLSRVGMVASPTFMLLSGMLLSVLAFGRPAAFDRLRLHLVDRALFTLTVGHLLLMAAGGHFASDARTLFITDTVAVAVILGTLLISHLSVSTRLALAGCSYVVGWTLHLAWHPVGNFPQVVEEVFAGPTHGVALAWSFPILQWFGVYLLGTALGEQYVASRRRGAGRAFCRRLILGGAVCASVAMALRLASAVRGWLPLGSGSSTQGELLGLQAKLPPGPIYLLFYGGLACVLIGSLLERGTAQPSPRWFDAAAVIGRTSLLTFVLQFAIFRSAALGDLLRVISPWPVVFALVVAIVWIVAWAWDRWRGNRLLVVGLESFVTAAARRAAVPTHPQR